MKSIFKVAAGFALTFLSASSPKAAEAQTKSILNTGVYYNLHRQEGRLAAGTFAGPVYYPASGDLAARFHFYASMAVTGPAAPVKVNVNGVGGFLLAEKANSFYSAATLRLAPNIKNKDLSLLNKFYLISGFPITKDVKHFAIPTMTLGLKIPLAQPEDRNKKISHAILIEEQRVPKL